VSPGDRFILVVVARVWGTILEVVPAAIVLLIHRRRATPSAQGVG
jgi:hypothetical protein